MIEKVTVYQVRCDRCGDVYNDGDSFTFPDKESARESAVEFDDWKEIDGKMYCPDCIEYDENKDEYVPKKPIE